MRGHNCITDPTARQWWRDYQKMAREGNPQGLSFTEYVATRVVASGTQIVTETRTDETPFYVSACGHRHAWGESCGSWTASQ